MASRLNPYLSFRSETRAAIAFYQDVFGGEVTLSTFSDLGEAGPHADSVMHAQLETPAGFTLMASDNPDYMPGTSNISVSLSGDDNEQLRGYWTKLTTDGSVTMPLERQTWGDEFGMVTDQFGIAWMVNITGNASDTPAGH